MPIIKFIKTVATGTELTVEVDGEIIKANTYFDFDGKDKVVIKDIVYEYDGVSTIKETLWKMKR